MVTIPVFLPHEPLAANLSRIAGELIEQALALIAHPIGEPEENTREIRTTIKRLRALLLLIRPALTDRCYGRESGRLRNAARRVALSRDLAIARKTIIVLAKRATGKRDRAAFAQVLKGFPKRVDRLTRTNHRKAVRRIAAALRNSRKSITRLCRDVHERDVIGQGLKEVYRAGRKRMKQAFAREDTASLHRWRTRVKNLYHLLQMLLPVWPGRLRKTVACLKRLHRKLGDDHDLAVVISVLRDAPERFGGARSIERVIRCLNDRSRQLRKASRKLGKEIFRQPPRRFIAEFENRWRQWRRPKRSRISPGMSGRE